MPAFPVAPSSHYQSLNMRPILWHGHVVWITQKDYAALASILQPEQPLKDASPEDIKNYDRLYEEGRAFQEQEAREIERVARLFTRRKD